MEKSLVRSTSSSTIVTEKEKTKESPIRSACLKGNTMEHLLLFYADEKVAFSDYLTTLRQAIREDTIRKINEAKY